MAKDMAILKVRKRNGRVVDFDKEKITEAVWKAAQSVGGKDRKIAEKLASKVVNVLEYRMDEKEIPTVEAVQDVVERVLIKSGYADTAKAYILYRQQHTKIRETKSTFVDVIKTIDEYIGETDWRVKENSNETFSFSGLLLHTAGKVMSVYNLNQMYTPAIAEAHRKAYFHIHDLSHGVIGYSFYRNEAILVRERKSKKILNLSLEQLFNLVNTPLENENGFEIKYTNNYEVLDEGGWTGIKRVLRHKSDKPLISFNTFNGHNLIVTPDHPFITLKKENEAFCTKCNSVEIFKTRSRRETKNGEIKDYYRCKSCSSTFSKQTINPNIKTRTEKRADQISINNYSITPKITLDLKENIILRPIDGWFIGLFIADGYFKTKYLSFEINGEDIIFKKLIDYLDENKFKYNLCQRSPRMNSNLQSIEGAMIVDVVLNELPQELQECISSIRPYAENKNLPIDFMNYNPEYIGGMLSGVIDGDGIVRNDDHWVSRANIRMVSKTLLSQIQFWLESQNINSSLCTIDSFGERVHGKNIITPRKQLYSLSLFIPHEKSHLFSECLKVNEEFKYSQRSYQKKEYSNLRKIENIKNDSEYVYDITTISNSFLCNGILAHNCAGWSLKNLLLMGFGGVPNKVDCKPAKHMSTVVHQMVNYIGCLQMEFAGAQAFSVHPKETVIVKDSEGNISVERIGEFCDGFIEGNPERWLGPNGIEYADISDLGFHTLSFNENGESLWRPIKKAIRHPVTDPLHLIRTNKGIVSASMSHSLFSLNSHQYLGLKERLLLESMENNGQKLFSYDLGDRGKSLGINAPEKVVQKLLVKGMLDSELMTFEGEPRHYSKYTVRKNDRSFCLNKTKDLFRTCKEVKTNDTEISNIASLSKISLPQENGVDLYKIIRGNKKLRKKVIVKLDDTAQLKKDIQAKTSLRKLSVDLGMSRGYIFSILKRGVIPFDIFDKYSSERREDLEFITNRNGNSIKRIFKGKNLEMFVKLVAWYLSEGYSALSWIGISQKDENNIRQIRNILDSLGLDYHVGNRDVKAITVHGIAALLIKEMSSNLSKNKTIPSFVFGLSDNLKRIFIEEIVKGDGTPVSNGWVYTSTSNKLITGLNLLATNLDWKTSIKMRHIKNYEENSGGRLTRYDLVMKTGDTGRIERHGSFESAVIFENTIPDLSPEYEYDLSVEETEAFIGGVGLFAMHNSSVDTLLAPFVRYDGLNYKQVKQNMQQLVFSLNIPSRWGSQYPFSNLTFDNVVPEDMKGEHAIVGGKDQDYTYSDLTEEMRMINQAFMEVLTEGDANGRTFTFPIPTFNLTKSFEWDSENSRKLFEMTAKYGTPYFQNYIGSDLDPKSIRAMCCRLNLDQRELMNRPGSMWGPGDNTGSIGVVTLNMNRLGYEAKTEDEFLDRIDHYMGLARDSLEIKRKVVERNIQGGLMPFTKVYLGSFNNHFSTIGLCGMNEASVNLLGTDIASSEGKRLAIKTLNFMRDKTREFQAETGNLYNVEATPAEGASYRLAREDKKAHPKIYTAGEKKPYLTNSTHLPVNYTSDLIFALEHQNDIQPLYTGGTIFHTFLGERMPDAESAAVLVRKIASNTRLPYFSITPTFSVCPVHGYIKGEHHTCPFNTNGG